MMSTQNGGAAFHVLMVCTANHCRSPVAEHLLRAAVKSSPLGQEWTTSSAGTRAESGVPMHRYARIALEERGVEVDDQWASARLTAASINQAQLILTAEASHRQAVVALVPRAVRITFSLVQFARLTALVQPFGPATPGSAGTELLRRSTLARSRILPRPPGLDDIADPMGLDLAAFRECAGLIGQQLRTVLLPALSEPGMSEEDAHRNAGRPHAQ